MEEATVDIKHFTGILNECLLDVSEHMRKHPGILHVMRSRLTFEKWFQIELLGRLIEKTCVYPNLSWHNEIGVSSKINKKGLTIDIGVKLSGEKFIGIELKIIPTNYVVDGFDTKTKAISNAIDGLINDLKKCRDDGYCYQLSIGLVFPLPRDASHRNHIDFEKQLRRLRQHGNLASLNCNLSEKYIARYYLLSNYQPN